MSISPFRHAAVSCSGLSSSPLLMLDVSRQQRKTVLAWHNVRSTAECYTITEVLTRRALTPSRAAAD